MTQVKYCYVLTLLGYFLTLLTVCIWPLCCFNDAIPLYVRWIVLLVPMLFPLHGLLQGRMYTFAWSHFLALIYFTLAVVALWQGDAPVYGTLLLIGSMLWFNCALAYVKLQARELKKAQEQLHE